jgi:uncharacterized protein
MKLPDVNVLLHAVDTTNKSHAIAKQWLEFSLAEPDGVGFVWLVLVGFVRVATRNGVLTNPLSVAEALSIMDEWVNHPKAQIVAPGERHADILTRLLLGAGTAGNLTNDAHLAAIAIEHNAQVCTFDHDFKRFAGLKFQLLS